MAASLNGVVINEILPDPTGDTASFDTDGDGTVDETDEFVELFNSNTEPVDISGWTLGNGGGEEETFVFPEGTIIPAGGYIIVIGAWNSTDPLPENYFELEDLLSFDDDGDEVILSDGVDTIAAVYNGADPDPITNPDLPAGAIVDDFGNATDGQSLERSPDGSDTIVDTTPDPECFLTGTLIATERGDVAVEQLKIGDRVQTSGGEVVAIKWIGRQTVDPATLQNSMRGYPVWIKAGALGNNLPIRDLYVSPDHAILLEGLLINAGALVNNVSILSTEPTEPFTYYHVELHKHALVLAEGTAAESYLPQKENRYVYDNGAEYADLYPNENDILAYWPMSYPRVSSKRQLPKFVSQRLNAIAATGELAAVAG